MSDHVQDAHKEELSMWQCNGWLLLYPKEDLGPSKGLIPLMAVVQEHKQKVQPVLDFWVLNSFVEAFTTNTGVLAKTQRVVATMCCLWI